MELAEAGSQLISTWTCVCRHFGDYADSVVDKADKGGAGPKLVEMQHQQRASMAAKYLRQYDRDSGRVLEVSAALEVTVLIVPTARAVADFVLERGSAKQTVMPSALLEKVHNASMDLDRYLHANAYTGSDMCMNAQVVDELEDWFAASQGLAVRLQ